MKNEKLSLVLTMSDAQSVAKAPHIIIALAGHLPVALLRVARKHMASFIIAACLVCCLPSVVILMLRCGRLSAPIIIAAVWPILRLLNSPPQYSSS